MSTGAGQYTITIERPITPGAVTTLTYTDASGTTTTGMFISHPGNVNGDDRTSVSDLLALINHLNGVSLPRFGNYSADIDRSGQMRAADLVRLIDLFNGAGAFDPWLGSSRPMTTGCP